MTEDAERPLLRVIGFNTVAGTEMTAIETSLEQMENEGYQLATAYAAPSANGDRIMHFFVLRRVSAPTEVKVEIDPKPLEKFMPKPNAPSGGKRKG